MERGGFTVIPAIDLKGGRCVRLRQGVAEAVTVYSDDPVAMARHWAGQGARCLHVVDLDGAFRGRPVHCEAIAAIAHAVAIPIEVGGGLRTDGDIEAVLQAGAARVILGTRACAAPAELGRLVARFGDRLAVGIDARDGRVQVRGWVETTRVSAVRLAGLASAAGVRTVICTDTATDGMLTGPNIPGLAAVCDAVRCRVIASGGISAPDQIAALRALGRPNLVGAIVGKALYDGVVAYATLAAAADAGGDRE